MLELLETIGNSVLLVSLPHLRKCERLHMSDCACHVYEVMVLPNIMTDKMLGQDSNSDPVHSARYATCKPYFVRV